MPKHIILLTVVFFSAICGDLLAATPSVPPIFFVEVVRRDGDHERVQYLWRFKNRFRSEIYANGNAMTTILDKDAGKVIVLLNSEKRYIVFPYNAGAKMGGELNIDPFFDKSARFESLGEESVGPVKCEKFGVESDQGRVICWVDKMTGIPVKFSDESGKMEAYWRNYTDKIDTDLFSIPKGYELKDPAIQK